MKTPPKLHIEEFIPNPKPDCFEPWMGVAGTIGEKLFLPVRGFGLNENWAMLAGMADNQMLASSKGALLMDSDWLIENADQSKRCEMELAIFNIRERLRKP